MEFYFAPMEGLTDRIFRRLHSRYFPGIDRYYMPFYSPTMHRTLSAKESRELPQAAEDSLTAIPQILTRNPEDFLWAAAVCRDLGYPEVNLNVGCPSGTVVAKGKGSGMLRDLEELRRFLDQVFSAAPLPVSIKTRIGLESPSEFPGILSIYNEYPLALLIVHPRVRSQYYKGEVNRDSFAFAAASSRNPLCYNGDILCTRQITDFGRDFPEVPAIMIGRGLLANPGMLSSCQDAAQIEAFMEELLEAYCSAFGSSRNAMFRMKEYWSYLRWSFPQDSKLFKQLRKTTDVSQFRQITRDIFRTLSFSPEQGEKTHPEW